MVYIKIFIVSIFCIVFYSFPLKSEEINLKEIFQAMREAGLNISISDTSSKNSNLKKILSPDLKMRDAIVQASQYAKFMNEPQKLTFSKEEIELIIKFVRSKYNPKTPKGMANCVRHIIDKNHTNMWGWWKYWRAYYDEE